jgi:hypothetical protein
MHEQHNGHIANIKIIVLLIIIKIVIIKIRIK